MRKLKIFITIFLLYECFCLFVLQINNLCSGIFNVRFCNVGFFKYFFLCIMLPIIVGLFLWWVPEISRIFTKQTPPPPERKDFEKIMMGIALLGLHKFLQNRPKTKEAINVITDLLKSYEEKYKDIK